MITKIHIGQAIKAARLKAGYSQFGLSYLMGVPRTYISKLENRRHNPNLKQIIRVCAVLEIQPWELLRDASAIVPNTVPTEACTENCAMAK